MYRKDCSQLKIQVQQTLIHIKEKNAFATKEYSASNTRAGETFSLGYKP